MDHGKKMNPKSRKKDSVSFPDLHVFSLQAEIEY